MTSVSNDTSDVGEEVMVEELNFYVSSVESLLVFFVLVSLDSAQLLIDL